MKSASLCQQQGEDVLPGGGTGKVLATWTVRVGSGGADSFFLGRRGAGCHTKLPLELLLAREFSYRDAQHCSEDSSFRLTAPHFSVRYVALSDPFDNPQEHSRMDSLKALP